MGGSRHTKPVLSKRLEAGRGALRRLPHLPAFHRRARAVGPLVTPLALHGVAPAPVTDGGLAKLETLVLQSGRQWRAAMDGLTQAISGGVEGDFGDDFGIPQLVLPLPLPLSLGGTHHTPRVRP